MVEINGEEEPCLMQDIESVLIFAPGKEDEGGTVTLKDGATGTIRGEHVKEIMKYESYLIRYHPMGVFLSKL